MSQKLDFSVYKKRRQDLLSIVQKQYADNKNSAVVLFAGFETERVKFRQESSFFYYTGITDPGVVMVLDYDGTFTLYVPNCGEHRSTWMHSPIELIQDNAKQLGFDVVASLGQPLNGYQYYSFFDKKECEYLVTALEKKDTIFTLYPDNKHAYIEQRNTLKHLQTFAPTLEKKLVDISDSVATMRRKKDMHEIEAMYKAVATTALAHEAAAQAMRDGVTEAEVQASLEYMFTGSGAQPSFPSIVATGKNGTVLHYTANEGTLRNGDLVVVDIGAEVDMYCADLTRTYPASGKFTLRQKELYNIVLETQQYIADLAKPGMWLSYKEKPEQSLNHLAKKFLEEKGYGKYFPHGVGHFLGLDVHDVGDYTQPLQEGDVITIEPGIYIPQEGIGIRIEDNYWMVQDGLVCLSEDVPKKLEDIEKLVQQTFAYDDEQALTEPDEFVAQG